MRQVLFASVRVYARRYVAAAVAIVIGVGFVVATGALTSAARNGILTGLREQYAGADLVAWPPPDRSTAERLVRTASTVPGAAAAVNAVSYQPVSASGAVVAETARIGSIAATPRLRWQQLTAGRYPAVGEALVDAHVSAAEHINIGDRLRVGRGADQLSVRVSGLVKTPAGGEAGVVYLRTADMAGLGKQWYVDNVVVAVPDGDTGPVVAALHAAAGGVQVQDVDAFLREQLSLADRHVDVLGVMLLVFAAIAMFVAALVIANTFTILLAQRAGDLAMLRCVGATRRQVLAALRAESLVMGAAAATLGVLVGDVLGHLLVALGGRAFSGLPLGAVSVSPRWLVGAWLLGVLVTLGASLLPARRAARVSPVAALRAPDALQVRSRGSVPRLVLAALAVLVGAVLLTLAVRQHAAIPMLAGGAVSFTGLLLVGPLLVPGLVRVLGLAVARLVAGRLAVANAMRNPRRTAATAGSLLVGVTLVSALLVGAATVRTTVSGEMDAQYPVDAMLASHAALPAGTLPRVARLDGVARAVPLAGVAGRVGSASLSILAVPQDASAVVHGHPDLLTPAAGTVYVPWSVIEDRGLAPDSAVTVRVGDRTTRLRLAGTELSGTAALVSRATLAALAPTARPRAVWVRAATHADPAELDAQLQAVARGVDGEVTGSLGDRARMDAQLTVMTVAALSLLGAGVIIALVGIGATLGLSVLERGREHALLRAMGLTRRQLRLTLALESLLLAVAAGVLGVVVGTVYAWVGAHTVLGNAIGDIPLTVPVGPLAGVVAAAAAAGLLAGVLPARRAARVTPAAGLSME